MVTPQTPSDVEFCSAASYGFSKSLVHQIGRAHLCQRKLYGSPEIVVTLSHAGSITNWHRWKQGTSLRHTLNSSVPDWSECSRWSSVDFGHSQDPPKVCIPLGLSLCHSLSDSL